MLWVRDASQKGVWKACAGGCSGRVIAGAGRAFRVEWCCLSVIGLEIVTVLVQQYIQSYTVSG